MLPRYRVDDSNKKTIGLPKIKKTRKKTTEQYIDELKEINDCIHVIGEYTGAKNRIRVKCLKCNHIWEPQAGQLLGKKATGCPECGKNKIGDKLRKTHTDFIKEVAKNNPNIQILSEYTSSKDYVDCLCLICQHTYKTIATNVAKGHGCPKCAIKKRQQNQTKTHEQFIFQLDSIKDKKYVLLNKYNNANTKIKCKCLVCNNVWETLPNNLLGGSGCPYCSNKIKTHSMFIEQAKKKNPNIKILGQYTSSHNKIECQCKICNYIWSPSATSILSKNGCPNCFKMSQSKNRLWTLEQYKNKLIHKRNDVVCTSKYYVNSKTPIEHMCTKCGYIWNVIPTSVIVGYGCPKCGIIRQADKKRKTREQYQNELISLRNNIVLLGEYKASITPTLHKCTVCGKKWYVTPNNILRGHGCPHCSSSKLEETVGYYLELNNIIFNRGMKYHDLIGVKNGMLSYDFYLPQYNLLIECQGEQHERPVKYFGGNKRFVIQKIHDTRKRKYAHDHNINLLEIWYYENNKIDKILEQILNNLKSESLTTAG